MEERIAKLSGKKFVEYYEKKIRNTIRKNKLLSKKDKIVVAVSGGKDSMSILYVLKKLGYDIQAMTLDVCVGEYSDINLENVKGFCKKLKVPLHIYSFKEELGRTLRGIKNKLAKNGYDYSPCMICGIMKRYLLNRKARELGFNTIVTGHNLDDEAQAFMMNVFRNDFKLAVRQGPMPGIVNAAKFIKRIKPQFFMLEEENKRYSQVKNFPVNYSKCPFSKASFRNNFKEFLNDFEKLNPSVKYNIMHFQSSVRNNLKKTSMKKIGSCKSCGEPSSRDLCKACQLIEELHKEK